MAAGEYHPWGVAAAMTEAHRAFEADADVLGCELALDLAWDLLSIRVNDAHGNSGSLPFDLWREHRHVTNERPYGALDSTKRVNDALEDAPFSAH